MRVACVCMSVHYDAIVGMIKRKEKSQIKSKKKLLKEIGANYTVFFFISEQSHCLFSEK